MKAPYGLEAGDVVEASLVGRNRGLPSGYGLITDVYEDSEAVYIYYEVQWPDGRSWVEPHEVEIVSEMEKN